MTAVIGVAERSCGADGSFVVRVSFPDATDHDVVVTDPAVDGDEDRLAWYFEEHLRFPFLDQDWDDDAVRRLRAYGQRLFEQVFGGAAAIGYRTLAQRGFDGCRLEVRGTAAFHRLHWEALFDPQLPVPAVLRLPVTRRVDLAPPGFELPPERSTLNILVVTARPAGRADVGFRTISRPLLDGLRTADRPVVVDLVRPGTWQAVERQLRDATKRHGSGYYQVIHFDVHGAVAGFDELEAGRAAERYLFGSGRPAAFEGERAFLFFETAADGKSEPVSAQQVADLLAEHRVPVAVLNACQSAKEPASEASLAQRLVAAGVPVTVGMAYSVTVSAAEKAMPLLYTGLARGDDPVTAMQTARRSLFDDKARRAYFDQSLNLEDWVLPVVFAQREVRLQLSEMTLEQQTRYFEREALVGDEPGTEYGFVGRDLDIQAIERRLLVREDHNMLLVKGMARRREVDAARPPGLVVAAHRPGGDGVPVQLRGPGLDPRPDDPRHRREAAGPGRAGEAGDVARRRPAGTAGAAAAGTALPADPGQHRVDHRDPGGDPARPARTGTRTPRHVPGPAAGRADAGAVRLAGGRGVDRPAHLRRQPVPAARPGRPGSVHVDRGDPHPARRHPPPHRRGPAQGPGRADDAARRVSAPADGGPARPAHPHPGGDRRRAAAGRQRRRTDRPDQPGHRVQPRQTRPDHPELPAAARPVHRQHPDHRHRRLPGTSHRPRRGQGPRCDRPIHRGGRGRPGRAGRTPPPTLPTGCRSCRCCRTSCAPASTITPPCTTPPGRRTTRCTWRSGSRSRTCSPRTSRSSGPSGTRRRVPNTRT
nr:hypothetical protein GCM10020092_064830 [Actinoplanes digitatis]